MRQAEFGFPVVVGSFVHDSAAEFVGPRCTSPAISGHASPGRRQAPSYAQQSPEQLQQLVAPIALYPDSLVAQILAASTFPEEVVEADRWVQEHPDLKGQALGQAVDQQPWDPSVKALAAFPSVLGNMDKNLSWTSTLGDAYYNQQQDVMDAVQVMRHKAQQSGNLKTTPQEVVRDDGPDVDIEPADPNVVYVPAYNPWAVYGYPVVAWPGWYPYPGIWFGGPYLNFGVGFGIGYFGGFGWGWGHWGFNWHNRYAMYGGGRYFSRSRTFYNRSNFYRGAGGRGAYGGRGGVARGGGERGGVGTRRSWQPSRRRGQAFQRKPAGGSRICCTSRSERRPLGCLQRLWAWRTGQELFVTRKGQRQWRSGAWRRWVSWRRPRRRASLICDPRVIDIDQVSLGSCVG